MNMLRIISCNPHPNLIKLKLIEYRKAIFEMENGRMQGRSSVKIEKSSDCKLKCQNKLTKKNMLILFKETELDFLPQFQSLNSIELIYSCVSICGTRSWKLHDWFIIYRDNNVFKA